MSINLDTNDIVRMFQVRATAELKRELDEVKWWEDRVRRGLVKREHVEAYIQSSKRIIRTNQSASSGQSGTFWAFQNFLAEVRAPGSQQAISISLTLIFSQNASVPSRKYAHMVYGLWRRWNPRWRYRRRAARGCLKLAHIDRFSRPVP
jgi:hypothetical protein